MSYVRKCKVCGERISLRKMPNGHWLPFEFQGDVLHECNKKEKTKVNHNHNHTNKQIIRNLPKLTKRELVESAIKNNNDLLFKYKKKYENDSIERLITPIQIQDKYLSGFCYLRQANRTFSINSMHYVEIVYNNSGLREKFKEIHEKNKHTALTLLESNNKFKRTLKQYNTGCLIYVVLFLLILILLAWR